MEKRLERLETVWSADSQTVQEASVSIEIALKWPQWDDPHAWAARIVANHGLDGAGIERAIALALTRCGIPRGEAWLLAGLGLERLLTMAAQETEAA